MRRWMLVLALVSGSPIVDARGGCEFWSGFEAGEDQYIVVDAAEAEMPTTDLVLRIRSAELLIPGGGLPEGTPVSLRRVVSRDTGCDAEAALVGIFEVDAVGDQFVVETGEQEPERTTLTLSPSVSAEKEWQAFARTVSRGAFETAVNFEPASLRIIAGEAVTINLQPEAFTSVLDTTGTFQAFVAIGIFDEPLPSVAKAAAAGCPVGLGPPLTRQLPPNSFFNLTGRSDPLGSGEVRPHKGTDYPAPTGEPLLAMADGSVFYGASKTWGNYAIVTHGDGSKAVYAHLHCVRTATGGCAGHNNRTVSKGTQIAEANNSGRSTGSHLHLELIPNPKRPDLNGDARVDPYSCHAQCGPQTPCGNGMACYSGTCKAPIACTAHTDCGSEGACIWQTGFCADDSQSVCWLICGNLDNTACGLYASTTGTACPLPLFPWSSCSTTPLPLPDECQ